MYPNFYLSPKLILTRWDIQVWLEVPQYYREYFEKIKDKISKLDIKPSTTIN